MYLENRKQMMDYLGAEQRNIVGSWCAVNHEQRKIYLSMWEASRGLRDGDEKASFIIREPHWGISETGNSSAARNDHDEKLRLIFHEGYQPFGYVMLARDIKAVPREIKETKTGFVFEVALKRRDDGVILGYPTRRINL